MDVLFCKQLFIWQCVHNSVRKVAIQEALVAFETDAGCKREEPLFVVGFVVDLLNTCFVREVHRKNTALVDLTKDRKVIKV